VALYPNGFKITLRIILQNVKQFKKLKGNPPQLSVLIGQE